MGIYHGTTDGTLTAEQKDELARIRFDVSRYDFIYCSPLRRCVETAQCLRIQGCTADVRIAERNFGIFEGLTAPECAARYPEEFASFQKFDAEFEIPSGESRKDHLERIVVWLQEACSYQQVLAITHGGTIDFLYRMASGMDLHGGSRMFSASNASLSTFDVHWPRVELTFYDHRLVA